MRRRSAGVAAVAAVAVGVAAVAGFGRLHSRNQTEPDRAVDAAVRLALSPETLTASGCTSTDASAMLGRLRSHATEVQGMFALASDLDDRVRAHSAAKAALRGDPANSTLAAAVQAAESQVNAATALLRSSEAAVRAIALDGLAATKVERLALCQANRTRRVPTGFWVATCTEAQWIGVEKAVVTARRAERLSETVPPAVASLLASIRAQPAVVDAEYQLAHILTDVRAAFVPPP